MFIKILRTEEGQVETGASSSSVGESAVDNLNERLVVIVVVSNVVYSFNFYFYSYDYFYF